MFNKRNTPFKDKMPDIRPNNLTPPRGIPYAKENDRLQSFVKWTKPEIDKKELAKFGWFFTGLKDLVTCAFCGASKSDWIIGDHPLNVHVQLSPGCPLLVRRAQNQPLQNNFDEQLPLATSIVKSSSGTEIIKLSGAEDILHPDFRSSISRLHTFADWPKALRLRPHMLSDAGFFYLGQSDIVKCFCCGVTIENWDPGWEPWEQHVHRFEDCRYVQLCKSPEFIEYVRAKFSGKLQDYFESRTNSQGEDELQRPITKNCNICLREPLNAIFIPCMHIYACIDCGTLEKRCPLCNQEIAQVKKCYVL